MSAAENAAVLILLALSSGSLLVAWFGFLFVAFAFATWFSKLVRTADAIAKDREKR